MALTVNGTTMKDVTVNGVAMEKVLVNGVEVYTADRNFDVTFNLSFSATYANLATDTRLNVAGSAKTTTFSHRVGGTNTVSGFKTGGCSHVGFYGGAGTASYHYVSTSRQTTTVNSRDFNATIHYSGTFKRTSDDGYPDVSFGCSFDITIQGRNGAVTVSPAYNVCYASYGSGTSFDYYYWDEPSITSYYVSSFEFV